jgi:hypothetical protein
VPQRHVHHLHRRRAEAEFLSIQNGAGKTQQGRVPCCNIPEGFPLRPLPPGLPWDSSGCFCALEATRELYLHVPHGPLADPNDGSSQTPPPQAPRPAPKRRQAPQPTPAVQLRPAPMRSSCPKCPRGDMRVQPRCKTCPRRGLNAHLQPRALPEVGICRSGVKHSKLRTELASPHEL